MTPLWGRVRQFGSGETAVLQVERANSRRWGIYLKARVARLAECHNNRRRVTTNTPAQIFVVNNRRFQKANTPRGGSSNDKWNSLRNAVLAKRLANKEEGTKQRYQEYFNEFLTFVGKTPDELIVQRQQDLLNPDRKIQRRIESLLLAFLAKKKAEGYAVATRQIYFASIRSFSCKETQARLTINLLVSIHDFQQNFIGLNVSLQNRLPSCASFKIIVNSALRACVFLA